MPPFNCFSAHFITVDDANLLRILDNRLDYEPEAVEAARAELERLGVTDKAYRTGQLHHDTKVVKCYEIIFPSFEEIGCDLAKA